MSDIRPAGFFFLPERSCHSYFPSYREKGLGEKHHHSHVPSTNLGSVTCRGFRKIESTYCEMLSFPMEKTFFQVVSSYLFTSVSELNMLLFVMTLAPEKNIDNHT